MPETEYSQFINFLIKRLEAPLPGREAHVRMAPNLKGQAFRTFEPTGDAASNATLIILTGNDDIEVLLTLRSRTLKSHSGQISLPGGRMEPNETIIETALREAEEEISLNSDNVIVIGKLSELFVPPSNNIIVPVVAELVNKQKFLPNIEEVEEIFYVKLSELAGDAVFAEEQWNYSEMDLTVPLWKVHSETPLWGATAMILSELVDLYNEFKKMSYTNEKH